MSEKQVFFSNVGDLLWFNHSKMPLTKNTFSTLVAFNTILILKNKFLGYLNKRHPFDIYCSKFIDFYALK